MGCMSSKGEEKTESKPAEQQEFSWDKRKKLDPKDYLVSKKKGETIVKKPGSIQGQQFVIEECEDCFIYILDNSDSVTVDLCTNCHIFVGPVEGSFFIRNCKGSKVIVACQQFRTRDCSELDVLLYSMTRPTIETSKPVRLGCFQYHYPELSDQFTAAHLTAFTNDWSSLYDFSQDPDSWTYLPEDENQQRDFLRPIPESEGIDPNLESLSAVPLTWGNRPKPFDASRFVLFFPNRSKEALDFTQRYRTKKDKVVVIQTKETRMEPKMIQDMFSHTQDPRKEKIISLAGTGSVIGMEINGEENELQDISVRSKDSEFFYVSPDEETSSHEIGTFFGLLTIDMNFS